MTSITYFGAAGSSKAGSARTKTVPRPPRAGTMTKRPIRLPFRLAQRAARRRIRAHDLPSARADADPLRRGLAADHRGHADDAQPPRARFVADGPARVVPVVLDVRAPEAEPLPTVDERVATERSFDLRERHAQGDAADADAGRARRDSAPRTPWRRRRAMRLALPPVGCARPVL